MRFSLSGYAPSRAACVVSLHFESETIEAACLSGFRVLGELPECQRIEISGQGYVVEITAPPGGGRA